MSTQSLIPASGRAEIVVPHGNLVLVADYARDGNDLTLTGPEGTVVVILGYFAGPTPATLISADGARVPGDLIAQLAESGDSSGQSAPDLGEPIGTADEVEGTATATLPGGTVVALAAGDAVYQDSLIETDAEGVVGITLLDGTTIGLSENGRLLLDEFVFDSATGAGSSALTVLQGVLATVTGEIGKNSPENVSIRALTGTIGIRGTTIVIEVDRIGAVEITVVGGRIVVTLPDGRNFYLNEAGDFMSFEGSGEATFTQGGEEHLEQLRDEPAFEAALTQARADLDGGRDQSDGAEQNAEQNVEQSAEQNEEAVESGEDSPSTEPGGQTTGFDVKLTQEGFTIEVFEARQPESSPSDPAPQDPPPIDPPSGDPPPNEAPVFTRSVFQFLMNQEEGDTGNVLLGRLVANDPEGNDVVYSMGTFLDPPSGDAHQWFEVDSNGDVWYTGGIQEHSESDYDYSFLVHVEDEHGARGGQATVEVDVERFHQIQQVGATSHGSGLMADTPPPLPAGYTATPDLGDVPTAPDLGVG